jgi:hypothetical protein
MTPAGARRQRLPTGRFRPVGKASQKIKRPGHAFIENAVHLFGACFNALV